MFCMKCGKKIHDESIFCRYCGAKQLDADEAWEPVSLSDGKGITAEGPVVLEDFEPLFPDVSDLDFKALEPEDDPEELPAVPTLARAEAGEFIFYGESKLNYKGQLEVEVRFNDTIAEDTDPMHHLFTDLSVIQKLPGGERREVPELKGSTAYVLLKNGICYAKDGKIYFWKEDGTRKVVGLQENVLELTHKGFLTARIFRSLRQVASSEHRDLMGYTYEAWYDIYDVEVEEKQYLL